MSAMEKKRVASDVDICVQLEDGSRLQGQFKPHHTLWEVVENLCLDKVNSFSSPVVIYTRQEIIGKENLSNTTLKSLGITEGRAMIRFIDKNPDELKTQANVYVPPEVKETTGDSDNTPKRVQSNTGGGGGGFAVTKDLMKALKKTPSTTVAAENGTDLNDEKVLPSGSEVTVNKAKYDWGTSSGRSLITSNIDITIHTKDGHSRGARFEAEWEPEPEINIIGERNAIIYSLDHMQKQIEELPDSFFDLTVQDLKLVLRDLKKISAGNEDAPLITERVRELEANKTMLNKIAMYKNCAIRIRFPDRYVLQAMFKPIDKISQVVDFVRTFLKDDKLKFYLFTIPPKNILPLESTLLECNFVPTAVVHFALEDDGGITSNSEEECFIKPEYLQKLTSAEGAIFAANKFRLLTRKSSTETNIPHNNNDDNNDDTNPKSYEHKPPSPSTGAIPKRPRGDDMKQST